MKKFDEEYPKQQVYIRLDSKTEVTIMAKLDKDAKFVKWMKGNKEYSNEKEVKLTIDGAKELTVVFE